MSLQLRRGRRSWTPSSPAPEERTFPRPSCAWCRPKSPTRAGQELDSFEGKSESDTFKGSCWCVIGHLTDFFRIYLFIYFVQPSWHGPKCNVSWRLKWFCRPTAKLFLANTFPSRIFRHIASNFHLTRFVSSRARTCIKIRSDSRVCPCVNHLINVVKSVCVGVGGGDIYTGLSRGVLKAVEMKCDVCSEGFIRSSLKG